MVRVSFDLVGRLGGREWRAKSLVQVEVVDALGLVSVEQREWAGRLYSMKWKMIDEMGSELLQ